MIELPHWLSSSLDRALAERIRSRAARERVPLVVAAQRELESLQERPALAEAAE